MPDGFLPWTPRVGFQAKPRASSATCSGGGGMFIENLVVTTGLLPKHASPQSMTIPLTYCRRESGQAVFCNHRC